jgi:LysR family transcriptional regulator (chromosome initiation inhibitor)
MTVRRSGKRLSDGLQAVGSQSAGLQAVSSSQPVGSDAATALSAAIRSIPIEQLTALQQIVETGSFEAAADELRISQSAISQRVKALESQLGQIVVQRTKPAQPTRTGQLLLRLARQIALAQEEAMRQIADEQRGNEVNIRIVVNADCLESWVLPALAPIARQSIAVDIRRQDEQLSSRLLRSGEVMAAITADEKPVQGCSSTSLGAMAYYAACAPQFARRWFPDGMNGPSLERAPLMQYDKDDSLQNTFIRSITAAAVHPTTHYVPTPTGFMNAIALGFGWGMIPAASLDSLPAGTLIRLSDKPLLRPLFWQQWRLSSPSLDAVAQAIIAASRKALVAQD